MPRPKDVKKYGNQYWQIAEILGKKGGMAYTLTFPDHKSAMGLRWDFYAFMRALRLEIKTLGKDAPESMKAALETLRRHRMCVSGNKLTFEPASDSPQAQLLEKAIADSDTRSLREMYGIEDTPAPAPATTYTPDLSAGMYDNIFKDDEK